MDFGKMHGLDVRLEISVTQLHCVVVKITIKMIFKKLDDLLKNNVYIKCSLGDYDAELYDNL